MLEAGIQFFLPGRQMVPVPKIVELATMAQSGGVSQIWVTDNLQSRNSFVVLAALASHIRINLGTAVMVQYFRSPVDVADAAAAVSELMDGQELSIGIARGNPFTHRLVRTIKPISMLRETAGCLKRLLAGEAVSFTEYPTLANYFNFVPETSFQLNFSPKSPVRLYCGGNAPGSLAVGGELMDGLIFGHRFQATARSGRAESLLNVFDEAAAKAGKATVGRRIAELKVAVSRDHKAAREFAKHSVGTRIRVLRDLGFEDEHFRKLGIEPADMDRLDKLAADGATATQIAPYVTEAMVDAIFVAGDPAYCRERIRAVEQLAHEYGFQQLMFSEFGPDSREGLRLLCNEVLPGL